jgi:hypothetical protein
MVKLILISTVIRPWAEQMWGRVLTPSNARDFNVAHSDQTCGSQVVLYLLATGYSFLRVMRPGHEVDHSPVPSIEVTNVWRFSSPSVFRA